MNHCRCWLTVTSRGCLFPCRITHKQVYSYVHEYIAPAFFAAASGVFSLPSAAAFSLPSAAVFPLPSAAGLSMASTAVFPWPSAAVFCLPSEIRCYILVEV